MEKGITVALITYMEGDNIRSNFSELKKAAQDLGEPVEFLAVDARQPLDDTPDICREFGIRYFNQQLPGYGGALQMAFFRASKDKLFIFDADGSPDPRYMQPMYEAMQQGADLVIASRHVEGARNVASRSSQIMSNICNFCYRLGMGMSVSDCSTSYRLYKTEDVQKLLLTSQNFDIMEEILLKLRLQKGGRFTVKEIPSQCRIRQTGKSKRSLLKFIYSLGRTLIKMMWLRILARREYQPQKHEKQAEALTKATIALGAALLAIVLLALIF